ncbi:cytochrome b N-terminal domain-containing protein [Chamaesiphon polymorphus]|uniref:Cytochrome B6 n=1 Tax=Chamaesiphon polymorphus CCALA 037 TaxID=2107692 RepID=A0A2T1GMI4_9CYAN|nr:cytochrome b N-terminal domain-containing protein [Chamaesiphon polymorphus]PSB59107.1 cytochrome B6 [Chamaesiphon polymorphus CCALA 037]
MIKDTTVRLQQLATIIAVSILSLVLTAAISGLLLAFYYEPSAGAAYSSLKEIDTRINFGWLILTVHHLAGNGFTILALIQIIVMFFGEQFRPAWIVAWVSGILLTLNAVGLGWTSMILDWSQQGFWRFKIELGTISAIPLIGPTLSTILTGGEAISTETVVHLYTLHSYILSIVAIGLSIFHLAGLSVQEQEIETAIAPELDPPS